MRGPRSTVTSCARALAGLDSNCARTSAENELLGLPAVDPRVAVRVLARLPHEVLKSALHAQLEALLLDHADLVVLLAPRALPAGADVAEKMYL